MDMFKRARITSDEFAQSRDIERNYLIKKTHKYEKYIFFKKKKKEEKRR